MTQTLTPAGAELLNRISIRAAFAIRSFLSLNRTYAYNMDEMLGPGFINAVGDGLIKRVVDNLATMSCVRHRADGRWEWAL